MVSVDRMMIFMLSVLFDAMEMSSAEAATALAP